MRTEPRPVTLARVGRIALPVVLSNATVPIQGAIDTAIVGNLGEAVFLAAVTLGATVVTLLFTSFNFLQMGVSGLTAEALGESNPRRVVNTLLRALLIAGAVAVSVILAARPIATAGLALFEGSAASEALAADYVAIRAWGAPAELANYALIGWFTGQEMTRRLFEMQIVTSVVNVCLNLLFVFGLGMDVDGVALGTAIAAYAGLSVGLWRARARVAELFPEGFRAEGARLFDAAELRRVVALNRDIFIRTLCLTGGFAWMARLGSQQGDVVLAANGVLMQFLHVSSYALDGFAMAAETLVGQAMGARDPARLRRSVLVSGAAAVMLAVAFAGLATLIADPAIRLFTNVEAVRAVAMEHAAWATLLPLAGVLAYHMDGVFIGAADGRGMRDAMVISVALFAVAGYLLADALGNHGLWMAVWLWMLLRFATLALRYPALERRATKPSDNHWY